MEYRKHKSCVNNCNCLICSADICVKNILMKFDKSRQSVVIDLKKSKMARINRSCPASHYRRKVMVEGHNQRQGPPPKRNTIRIFHKISEHQQFSFADSIARIGTVFGVRGVNQAPPSAREREKNVHEFVQCKNQTESIAV